MTGADAARRSASPHLHRTSLSAFPSRLPRRLSRPGQIVPFRRGGHGEPDLFRRQAVAGLRGLRRPRPGECPTNALGLAASHRRRWRPGARLPFLCTRFGLVPIGCNHSCAERISRVACGHGCPVLPLLPSLHLPHQASMIWARSNSMRT